MNLKCKYCDSTVLPENIRYDTHIAKCAQCGAVFGVATQLSTLREQTDTTPPPPVISTPADYAVPAAVAGRPTIAMPQSYTLTEENGVLVLTRMWFDGSALLLIGFCIFWNGFMLFFNVSTVVNGQGSMLIFASLHALVGVLMAYGVFCRLLNNTVVRVGQGELRVTHGPLPTPAANKHFMASDLKQLYTREVVQRGKRGRRSYTYDVCVIAGPQQKVQTLVTGFPDAHQALFLEQQIERVLWLRDEPVPGELPR